MGRVILGNCSECYVCGTTRNLERHHIYGAGNRKVSERYGACVMLCHDCHRGKYGAHGIGSLKDRLKREAQIVLMNLENWSVEDFIKIFGRSYL